LAESRRPVRSYVLRQGRLTPGQEKALESLWPEYGLSLEDENRAPVFDQEAPLTLEIGFGMGESLAEQARLHPDRNFIGIEVHRPGVGHLLMQIRDLGLRNLRIYQADSLDVLNRAIADSSLSVLQVFFPDPWPKKRHHKRRLINEAFIRLAHQKLVPQGVLHVATDWQPYAEEIVSLFETCAQEEGSAGPGSSGQAPAFRQVTAPARSETKFERRGKKLGHSITDLAYQSVSNSRSFRNCCPSGVGTR
jgi:tRNA (guanine-N7-)-methyltransferase